MIYNILIVDDSKLINNNLKSNLEQEGHYVEQAFTFETAIDCIRTHRFDYVLLDLILPDGEGEMLLPFIKRADARVIVMTTDRDTFRRERLFGFGIVDYIIKDRYFDDVLSTIKTIIQQVESNTEYTILVIDDSNFIRNHLELLLHSRGYLILTASNGEEAFKIIDQYKIDAIIADLEMPILDGFGLLKKIRRHQLYSSIPVMILTGSNNPNLIAKVIKHGAKDLIRKPYIIEELLLKIDKMISELKQEKIISEDQQKFDAYHSAILNSALCLKFSYDFEIIYINSLFSKLLSGTDFCDLAGLNFKNIVNNVTLSMLRHLKSLKINSPHYQELFIFTKHDRSICYISATVSAVYSTDKKTIELFFIGHDVTDIHLSKLTLQNQVHEQVQVNLKQQQMMFHQAKMASMGEMIENIAHQWLQPLNILGLLIQDLDINAQNRELNHEQIHTMADQSLNQIRYMSKTIDDFRNFFHPNSISEPFDIAIAIEKTLDIVSVMLKINQINVELRNVEKGKIFFSGSQNELQQVLLNLIYNAKDAIVERYEKESGEKYIIIESKIDNGHIILNLEDSGFGIEPSAIEHIFDPYFTTKKDKQGSGIGLYISKMIIEQKMRGELKVSNTTNGASFSIILPLSL